MLFALSGLVHHRDDLNVHIQNRAEDEDLPADLAGRKVQVGKKLKLDKLMLIVQVL